MRAWTFKPSRRVKSKSTRWAAVISGYGSLFAVSFSKVLPARVHRKLSGAVVLLSRDTISRVKSASSAASGLSNVSARAFEHARRLAIGNRDAIDERTRLEVGLEAVTFEEDGGVVAGDARPGDAVAAGRGHDLARQRERIARIDVGSSARASTGCAVVMFEGARFQAVEVLTRGTPASPRASPRSRTSSVHPSHSARC